MNPDRFVKNLSKRVLQFINGVTELPVSGLPRVTFIHNRHLKSTTQVLQGLFQEVERTDRLRRSRFTTLRGDVVYYDIHSSFLFGLVTFEGHSSIKTFHRVLFVMCL